jgi:Flp pilus assembly protein TadG
MSPTPFSRTARRLARRLRQERGQALVEFAMVLPVLMLIVVGILTFGRYLNYASQETQMAAGAARWAAVDNDPASNDLTQTLQAYTQQQATAELQAGSTDVTSPAQVYVYCQGSSCVVGNWVRACVTATVRLLPMLGSGPSAQIVETATMRIEVAQSYNSTTGAGWTTANNPTTTVPAQCPTS